MVCEGGDDSPGVAHLPVDGDTGVRIGGRVETVGADREARAYATPGGEVDDGPADCVRGVRSKKLMIK